MTIERVRIDPRAVLLGFFERCAGLVSDLLAMLPEAAMHAETRYISRFTLPEQVVHVAQVMRFTLATVHREVLGEASRLPPVLEEIARMTPEEAHAALSATNLAAARAGLERFETLEDLRHYWEASVAYVVAEVSELTDGQLLSPVTHPMTSSIGGSCFEFLLEMLCGHTRHHLGQMTLQAKIQEFAVPSPLGTGEAPHHSASIYASAEPPCIPLGLELPEG